MKRLAGEVAKMPRELWPMVVEHWSAPKSFLTMAAQLEALPQCAKEMSDARSPEEIPVIVLTSGESSPLAARHVIAKGSGHWIHLDEPELVVAAVRDLVNSQRD